MMRFNKNGGFNVPFCKKPNRFSPALITKITNQVSAVSKILELNNYIFKHQEFEKTILEAECNDLIYCDPPYIGRHVDYFDSWSESEEKHLHKLLAKSGSRFIMSTWLQNRFRVNEHIFSTWKDCSILTKEHFYHVGAKEKNRNAVIEALLINFLTPSSHNVKELNSSLLINQKLVENKNLQLTLIN